MNRCKRRRSPQGRGGAFAVTSGSDVERILGTLDAAVDLPSDRLSNGRRYTFRARQQADRADAISSLKSELEKIIPIRAVGRWCG